MLQLNNLIKFQFLQLASCSNYTCSNCLNELKKSANLKFQLIRNQERLQEMLSNLDDDQAEIEEIVEPSPIEAKEENQLEPELLGEVKCEEPVLDLDCTEKSKGTGGRSRNKQKYGKFLKKIC